MTYHGKKLDGAAAYMITLLITEICLLQEVKHDAVYFPGYIFENSLVVVFVSDLGRKYFDCKAQIV